MKIKIRPIRTISSRGMLYKSASFRTCNETCCMECKECGSHKDGCSQK